MERLSQCTIQIGSLAATTKLYGKPFVCRSESLHYKAVLADSMWPICLPSLVYLHCVCICDVLYCAMSCLHCMYSLVPGSLAAGCGVKIVGSESWSVLISSNVSFEHLSDGLILWSGCGSLSWLDIESLHRQCERSQHISTIYRNAFLLSLDVSRFRFPVWGWRF